MLVSVLVLVWYSRYNVNCVLDTIVLDLNFELRGGLGVVSDGMTSVGVMSDRLSIDRGGPDLGSLGSRAL